MVAPENCHTFVRLLGRPALASQASQIWSTSLLAQNRLAHDPNR